MQSLLTRPARQPLGNRGWWVASGLAHLTLLAALLHLPQARIAATDRPGDRTGHQLLLTYSPGHAPSASATSANHPAPKQPPPPVHAALSAPKPPPTPAAASTAPSATAAAGTSSDAFGNGNVTIAMVVLHPTPRPDLSQLPSGTRGDVIVDVVIDANGKIVKTTMASGLGHGVDETVLAAIQQWTYQPATRNGVPVASEQELLFHYERS